MYDDGFDIEDKMLIGSTLAKNIPKKPKTSWLS